MQSKIFSQTVSAIYPNTCISCEKLLPSGFLCKSCKEKINPIELKLCSKCGLPLKFCCCNTRFFYFDKALTIYENDGCAKKIMYNFKFKANKSAGYFFAGAMAAKLEKSELLKEIDCICPVPMYFKNRMLRGYNQSKLLADTLADLLSFPCLDLLKQKRKSKVQHELTSISERFENTKGKYAVKNKNKSKIIGKNILIADDIKTTGATLSECARMLKLSGAEKVFVISALTTFRKPES